MRTTIVTVLILVLLQIGGSAQSKKSLKDKIKTLRNDSIQLAEKLNDTETKRKLLEDKFEKFTPVAPESEITQGMVSSFIKLNDNNWREEKNVYAYVDGLESELGKTFYLNPDSNKLIPLGAVDLLEYKFVITGTTKPNCLKERWITTNTKFSGSGNAVFAELKGEISAEEVAKMSVCILGKREIKVSTTQEAEIAAKYKKHFDFYKTDILYICVGMNIVEFSASVYEYKGTNASITSPTVNVGGEFYQEQGDREKRYYIQRQLMPLMKPTQDSESRVEQKVEAALEGNDQSKELLTNTYAPDVIIETIIDKELTQEELFQMTTAPAEFKSKLLKDNTLDKDEIKLINFTIAKVDKLPDTLIIKENKELEWN